MALPNLFLDDLTLVEPADLQQAIVNLAQSGVEEKFRLDFKETWEPDKHCRHIVAFANTYGGLLILGVSDDRQTFPGLPVPSKSDVKTQIAGVIATRISPVPVFELHTCPSPAGPSHSLVLIRVSPQPKVHMYLTGDKPVYVRNEDQSIPASAVHLQALLERVRNAQENDRMAALPGGRIAIECFVTKANNPSAPAAEREKIENRRNSPTFLQVTATPVRALMVGLDSVMEQRFIQEIYTAYPMIGRRVTGDFQSSIRTFEDRARSWFLYHYLDLDRDHDSVWAFNNEGVIQFICECSGSHGSGDPVYWSLTDFFIHLNSTLRLMHSMWSAFEYYGAGTVSVDIKLPELSLAKENIHYPSLYYGSNFGVPLRAAREVEGRYPVSSGGAEALLGYDDRISERTQSLMNLGNQVLRDLRFDVDLSVLGKSLKDIDTA